MAGRLLKMSNKRVPYISADMMARLYGMPDGRHRRNRSQGHRRIDRISFPKHVTQKILRESAFCKAENVLGFCRPPEPDLRCLPPPPTANFPVAGVDSREHRQDFKGNLTYYQRVAYLVFRRSPFGRPLPPLQALEKAQNAEEYSWSGLEILGFAKIFLPYGRGDASRCRGEPPELPDDLTTLDGLLRSP